MAVGVSARVVPAVAREHALQLLPRPLELRVHGAPGLRRRARSRVDGVGNPRTLAVAEAEPVLLGGAHGRRLRAVEVFGPGIEKINYFYSLKLNGRVLKPLFESLF